MPIYIHIYIYIYILFILPPFVFYDGGGLSLILRLAQRVSEQWVRQEGIGYQETKLTSHLQSDASLTDESQLL